METFTEYMVATHKYLNELGLFHWLIGGALLGYMREGKPLEWDKELNFGVFGKDLTCEILKTLQEKYTVDVRYSSSGNGITFLLDKRTNGDMWQEPYWFTALQPMYFKNDWFYYALLENHCCIWDKKFSKNMKLVDYLGEKFYIPNPPEDWLVDYYGEDWRVPNKKWNWLNNAKNYKNYEDF